MQNANLVRNMLICVYTMIALFTKFEFVHTKMLIYAHKLLIFAHKMLIRALKYPNLCEHNDNFCTQYSIFYPQNDKITDFYTQNAILTSKIQCLCI